MNDPPLLQLAARAGLSPAWHDVFGNRHEVAPDTLRALLGGFGLDGSNDAACHDSLALLDAEAATRPALVTIGADTDLIVPGQPGAACIIFEDGSRADITAAPHHDGHVRIGPINRPGYHRLELADGGVELAVAPARAFTLTDALARQHRSGRAWALAAQVYSLRRPGDGGIGDFAGLASFAAAAARHGADAVAISPVHALYACEPGHFGPYGPSSRSALNPVYASLDCPDAPDSGNDLIDWRAATPRRYTALRAGFARDRGDAGFRAFAVTAPRAIRLHALFEAICTDQIAQGGSRDWRQWPSGLRDPGSAEIAALTARCDNEIEFHLYAQWRAVAGLRAAQNSAMDAGMAVGLIADLAVGADPAGSDAWGRPDEVLRGATVGAPPDEFNRDGQNWGLTAFSPRGLQRSGYAALRDMLQSALEPVGGVRIDHAMGLARLWVIPDGATSSDGCYLRYPFDDMRRLLVLESARHEGIVLAEDLGTVPEGFRESLAASGISGMSVLWFERDGNRFIPPAHWRPETVALTTTHDLPTAAGWWHGTDIGWRQRLGIPGEDESKREFDRGCLWDACQESGAALSARPTPDAADAIADTLAAHVATAASDLVILPVEDALALTEQPNIPGTIEDHPNWRRRLPGEAATMLDAPSVATRLATLDRKRKSP